MCRLYAPGGRGSIAPEELLRALLLEAFYGVRSERQSMEQVTDDMPFRSFIGLSTNAPVWDMTVFTKNPERLPAATSRSRSSRRSWATRRSSGFCPDGHFSVDGPLTDPWRSMKSVRQGRQRR